jgi:hypothetical protein
MASPGIEQLREDALTMLVLWATTQEYSAVSGMVGTHDSEPILLL